MPTLDTELLTHWFKQTQRDLPWRNWDSPYAIWVSEIMLQQTQVKTVIPYFYQWMEQFPTIESLAESTLERVMKAWEGLGYYSRAKNLHKGAQFVVTHFQGKLPSTATDLKKIPGLGAYTVGALLAFAFKQKAAAVDGNVLRVLSRYFQVGADISKPLTIKHLQEVAYQILPDHEPWIITEALIELGALICKKKPLCSSCPLQKKCQAFLNQTQNLYPYSSKKIEKKILYRQVPVIVHQNKVLIRQVPKGEIMADLHEFPYFEMAEERIAPIIKFFNFSLNFIKPLKKVSHSFTKYQAQLSPFLFESEELFLIPGYFWTTFEELKDLAFSSGHRKILNQLFDSR